jgi:hypothetical protein
MERRSNLLRFLWISTAGYRLQPWKSPYLRWRIETYSGKSAEQIRFAEFWQFVWRERRNLVRYLHWVERNS